MNKANMQEAELEILLKQTLKDDLTPETEARLNRQYLNLKRILDRHENPAEAGEWPWMHRSFRKEILAVASAIMLTLGAVMHLSGSQTALAHSIEQLKVIVTISTSLNRAAFMDCTVLKPADGGGNMSYHILWRANGDTRVDMVSAGGTQTMWISNEGVSFAGTGGSPVRSMPLNTIAPGSVWQLVTEFMSPSILVKHMEEQYGLMQTGGRSSAGSGEALITGRQNRQAIEIIVDARTYLPKLLKKYETDSDRPSGKRDCTMEARFRWNQPVSPELFVPGPSAR